MKESPDRALLAIPGYLEKLSRERCTFSLSGRADREALHILASTPWEGLPLLAMEHRPCWVQDCNSRCTAAAMARLLLEEA